MYKHAFINFLILVLIVACAPQQEAQAPLATNTPSPTSLPTSTNTPIPTSTATPTPLPMAGPVTEDYMTRIGKGWVNDLTFSPNGKILSVTTSIGVYLYQLDTMELLSFLPSDAPVKKTVFINNSTVVTGTSDGVVTMWDIQSTPEILETWKQPNPIVALGVSGDNTILIVDPSTDSHPGVVKIIEYGKDTAEEHNIMSGYVFDGSFSPEKNLFVLETWMQNVSLIDTTRMRLIVSSVCGGRCSGAFVLSHDGDFVAATYGWGNSAKILLYNITSQKKVADFNNPDVYSRDLALSADNKILASASDEGLYLWDTTRRELINSFEGASKVAFSPDRSLLASISFDGILRIREAISSDLLFEIEGFASLGKATFHDDFIISIYSRDGGSIRVDQSAEGHDNFYYLVGFETRGNILIRDITTGEIIKKFRLPEGIRLLSIALSPDNTKIASLWDVAGNRKVVAVFDVLTGEQLHVIRGDDPIAFSEDGSLLIIGSGNKTIIWDIEAGESLSLDPASFPEKFVRKSNTSPDGSVWATASGSGIFLQSTQGGGVSLKGHTRPIYDLAFSADGKFLYSSSYDGTIIIWDIEKILYQP